MGTLVCWTPLNINESLVLIHITLCLMLFVCLSSTTNPSFMNMQIDLRDWMTTNPAFDSDLGNRINLSNQARDRSLLGYEIGINVLLKPPMVSNSLKRLRGCQLQGEF
jgi:hypothetical protein